MKKLHVVLADDDSDDSYIFNAAVEQSLLPIDLTVAEDGQKLLSYLNSSPLPDLIFLDINMPYKNGIECLNEIRSDERYKKVPIVMYSTTNNRLNVDACYRGGANFYIVKPNTCEEIDRMVQKLCTEEWTSNVSIPPKEEFILTQF